MIKYSWHTILSTLYIIHYYALQLGPCLSFLFDKIHRRLNPWRENNDIILMLRERKLQLQLKWKVSSVLVVAMWSYLSKWEHFISLSLSLSLYFILTRKKDSVLNILLLGRGCSCGSCSNQTELLKIIKINEVQQQHWTTINYRSSPSEDGNFKNFIKVNWWLNQLRETFKFKKYNRPVRSSGRRWDFPRVNNFPVSGVSLSETPSAVIIRTQSSFFLHKHPCPGHLSLAPSQHRCLV